MLPTNLFEKPMRYLCLVYIEEKKFNALSMSEMDALVADALAYDDVLRKSGHYIVSDALYPAQTATTLRMRGDELSITDGPFAQTREQLGGFILIEAHNLNEAMHIAAKIPRGRLGSIEVRPVMEVAKP